MFREIELSNSKIKTFLVFSQKRPPNFSAQTRKNKKNPPRKKISYISGNGDSEKNLYISGNRSLKKILILPETELPYILGKVYSEP